jgi:hypothetical protein
MTPTIKELGIDQWTVQQRLALAEELFDSVMDEPTAWTLIKNQLRP